MDLLHRLADWVARPQRQQLVNQLTSLSLEKVWRRVAHRVPAMRPAVARGYIRARAIHIVERHAETLSWQHPRLQRTGGAEIRNAALEQVVDRLSARAVRLAAQQGPVAPARRAA